MRENKVIKRKLTAAEIHDVLSHNFSCKILVFRVFLETITSRVKHSKMSLVQMGCVEQQCMLYLSTRSLSHGQSKTPETEVGWPYPRQLKNAGTRGWRMPLSLVSTNGMQKIWVMNNWNYAHYEVRCIFTSISEDCFLEPHFPPLPINHEESSSRTNTDVQDYIGNVLVAHLYSFVLLTSDVFNSEGISSLSTGSNFLRLS